MPACSSKSPAKKSSPATTYTQLKGFGKIANEQTIFRALRTIPRTTATIAPKFLIVSVKYLHGRSIALKMGSSDQFGRLNGDVLGRGNAKRHNSDWVHVSCGSGVQCADVAKHSREDECRKHVGVLPKEEDGRSERADHQQQQQLQYEGSA